MLHFNIEQFNHYKINSVSIIKGTLRSGVLTHILLKEATRLNQMIRWLVARWWDNVWTPWIYGANAYEQCGTVSRSGSTIRLAAPPDAHRRRPSSCLTRARERVKHRGMTKSYHQAFREYQLSLILILWSYVVGARARVITQRMHNHRWFEDHIKYKIHRIDTNNISRSILST